jgi:hypothetical protein
MWDKHQQNEQPIANPNEAVEKLYNILSPLDEFERFMAYKQIGQILKTECYGKIQALQQEIEKTQSYKEQLENIGY